MNFPINKIKFLHLIRVLTLAKFQKYTLPGMFLNGEYYKIIAQGNFTLDHYRIKNDKIIYPYPKTIIKINTTLNAKNISHKWLLSEQLKNPQLARDLVELKRKYQEQNVTFLITLDIPESEILKKKSKVV